MAWFCDTCGTQLVYTKKLRLYSCPKCDPELKLRLKLKEAYYEGFKDGYNQAWREVRE